MEKMHQWPETCRGGEGRALQAAAAVLPLRWPGVVVVVHRELPLFSSLFRRVK